MRRLFVFLVLTGLLNGLVARTTATGQGRRTLPMDSDWKFTLGDPQGADAEAFDDRGWRTLNVPHDWSIEGAFDANNPTGRGGGYLPSGVGWYRKRFTLPAGDVGHRVFVEFDGVMANSDVWIDGFHLGKRPYGYVSFRYELTGHLHFGDRAPNVLAVRTDTSLQPASRWYTGAGIYRHVRLVFTSPVHIGPWGVFVTTPKVAADQAVVHVQTTVVNQSDAAQEVTLETTLVAPEGRSLPSAEAVQSVPAGKSVDFQQDISVAAPHLWDLDHPDLYRAMSKLRAGGAALDDNVTPFGIRQARFDAATGFWLNGKNIKLKGVCLHHDAGGLGAAVPLSAWERRLALLKQIGCNAIRTSHNPVAPEFLDLADRMGFLVMDEMFDCWTLGKNTEDYHLYFKEWSQVDLRDTVRRDRNHPSIVIYSAGNEIRDVANPALAPQVFKPLRDAFHEVDPTRPVTMAVVRPNGSGVYQNGFAELMDVVGQNYRENELLAAHRERPERKIIGTENTKTRPVWLAMRDNPAFSGEFLWTGFDYLGESVWPNVVDGAGLFDRTGTPRPIAYEFQSYWSEQPMVHIVRVEQAPAGGARRRGGYERFSDWTPRDPATTSDVRVEVYSNCEEVELFLNGRSLGIHPRSPDAAPFTWSVPFEAGVIKAVGKNKGQVVATHALRTAGKPAKIVLSADRTRLAPDWDPVAYITATVVDANGVPNPSADDLITFHLAGPGAIAAVDNGDLASHEAFHAFERQAFQGQCIAILKATAPAGAITLTASAAGLTAATITIDTTPIQARAPASGVVVSTAVYAPPAPTTGDSRLPTLFIIGDSTVNNHTKGLLGWGDPIAGFFDKSKIDVLNRARGGRSSRTFLTEGLWDQVFAQMKPGDFVLMQFGHNDGGSLQQNARASLKGTGEETEDYLDPKTGKKEVVHTYGWYMRKYVADAKAKGATPIVCSPIPRNIWKDDHTVVRASSDYGKWAADVATMEGAAFIDLNDLVAKRYEALGPEKVKAEYFPGDHTHTSPSGAHLNASMVVQGLKALPDCALCKFLLPESAGSGDSTPSRGK